MKWLKKKMQRQGMLVTVGELKDLAKQLNEEYLENCKDIGIEPKPEHERRFQINIINKEGLSDTWRIEK